MRNGRKNHDFALEKQRVRHVIALILANELNGLTNQSHAYSPIKGTEHPKYPLYFSICEVLEVLKLGKKNGQNQGFTPFH